MTKDNLYRKPGEFGYNRFYDGMTALGQWLVVLGVLALVVLYVIAGPD